MKINNPKRVTNKRHGVINMNYDDITCTDLIKCCTEKCRTFLSSRYNAWFEFGRVEIFSMRPTMLIGNFYGLYYYRQIDIRILSQIKPGSPLFTYFQFSVRLSSSQSALCKGKSVIPALCFMNYRNYHYVIVAYIQSVPGGNVSILRGHNSGCSKQKSIYAHVS
jgi:hypothetical protein